MKEIPKETQRVDFILPMAKVNGIAVVLALLISLLFALAFIFRIGGGLDEEALKIVLEKMKISNTKYKILGFITVFIVGISFHELLHGITFALVNEKGFKSIKFGITTGSFTPYCHCTEPLKRNYYILVAAIPGIIMGIFPLIVGFIIINPFVCFVGYLFILAALGDVIIVYYNLKYVKKDEIIVDNPSKIGFSIFR